METIALPPGKELVQVLLQVPMVHLQLKVLEVAQHQHQVVTAVLVDKEQVVVKHHQVEMEQLPHLVQGQALLQLHLELITQQVAQGPVQVLLAVEIALLKVVDLAQLLLQLEIAVLLDKVQVQAQLQAVVATAQLQDLVQVQRLHQVTIVAHQARAQALVLPRPQETVPHQLLAQDLVQHQHLVQAMQLGKVPDQALPQQVAQALHLRFL